MTTEQRILNHNVNVTNLVMDAMFKPSPVEQARQRYNAAVERLNQSLDDNYPDAQDAVATAWVDLCEAIKAGEGKCVDRLLADLAADVPILPIDFHDNDHDGMG